MHATPMQNLNSEELINRPPKGSLSMDGVGESTASGGGFGERWA
jgi:hypothetical protein